MVNHTFGVKGAISPLPTRGHHPWSDIRTTSHGKSCGISTIILLLCVLLASGHGELNQRGVEKASFFTLGPPGLTNPHMPSYKSLIFDKKQVQTELTQHTVKNPIKEDITLKGLRIATINVTTWSKKIQRMITYMYAEYDILLIQEHHKIS